MATKTAEAMPAAGDRVQVTGYQQRPIRGTVERVNPVRGMTREGSVCHIRGGGNNDRRFDGKMIVVPTTYVHAEERT